MITSDVINENTNPIYETMWEEVRIPMRDGFSLAGNLYRPNDEGRFPVILTMSPYGKDLHFTEFAPANPNIAVEYSHSQDKGPLVGWETPNPDFWVPQGYAVLRIDERVRRTDSRPSERDMEDLRERYDTKQITPLHDH